jgi:hypothetical protein
MPPYREVCDLDAHELIPVFAMIDGAPGNSSHVYWAQGVVNVFARPPRKDQSVQRCMNCGLVFVKEARS